jgi:hypothetical protein
MGDGYLSFPLPQGERTKVRGARMTSPVRAFSLTQTLSRWERDFLDDL